MAEATDPAVIVSVVAAAISLGSCVASFTGAFLQRRSIDFNNCLEIVKQLGEALRRVRNADDADREFELVELLNLLEALAMLVNRRRIGRAGIIYTEHFLLEAWAHLRSNPEMLRLVEGAITGTGTFDELKCFAANRRREVDKLAAAYASLAHS